MRGVWVVVACASLAGPLWAAPGSGADFSFHMVKPPRPGQKRLITIQIDPVAQARRLAPPAPVPTPVSLSKPATRPGGAAPAQGRAHYGWFWQLISPGLGKSPGRFDRALAALSQGPDGQGVKAPSPGRLRRLARTYGKALLMTTAGTQVSPAFALAVMAVESAGKAKAVSRTGAKGLMQLMPATAKRFHVSDIFDARQNIRGGVAYLDWLMQQFNGDPLMVLAAYNAGEAAVLSAGGVPKIDETRDYVPKVLAAWREARKLCMTPPDLVSDGCVFRPVTRPRAKGQPSG